MSIFQMEFCTQESDRALPKAASLRYIAMHYRRPEASRFGHTCPRSRFRAKSCLGFLGSLWRRLDGVFRLYSLSFLSATTGKCMVGSGRIAGLGKPLPRLERTDRGGVPFAERRVAHGRRPGPYREDR